MIKIGEFSQLARVPVKTLRYYDEIGLLKPAIVDKFTSYRYYTLEQLPRLNRILALKELGLSLEQIATLLNDDLTLEQIRGMFRLKQAEIQQHIQEEREKLARIEARIHRIEMEGKMPDQEAAVKQVPSMKILSYREMLPDTKAIPAFFDVVMGAVMRDGGVQYAGPMMALYHHDAFRTVEMDTEIAIPVPEDYNHNVRIDENRVMTVRTLPAATVAGMMHHGSYDNIDDTYIALTRWIVERGYTLRAPAAEVYVRSMGQTDNPAELLTEIRFVVEKQPQPA